MSTAMAVAGSAMAAQTTTLSSTAAFGASSGVQQLGAVRSPRRLDGSRMVAVRASHSSHERPVKSNVLVALVAASAALALNVADPVPSAHAGLFGADNVKVEQGATSAVRAGSANSGTRLGEGSLNTSSGDELKVPNPLNKVGELNPLKGGLKDTVQRKVAGAKDMAESAKSTVNGILPDASTAASEVVSSEGSRGAAGEVAKNAGKGLMSKVTGN